ncbi:MAG: zf-HC2 domain-containing protein [Acidobacteria bacterium]|nr:zf-HC2 domain-containing protein [Acidobacteriota bacterium]
MNCREIQSSLDLYRGGEMSGALREEIRIHLESCVHCRQEWEAGQVTWRLLDSWADASPSEDFDQTVLARMRTLAAESSRGLWQPRWWSWKPALGLAAVLVLIVAISLLLPFREIGREMTVSVPDDQLWNDLERMMEATESSSLSVYDAWPLEETTVLEEETGGIDESMGS